MSVKELLAAVDPDSQVRHNEKVEGRLSGILRQVDVWVEDAVAGIEIRVAVECKRRGRAVDVGIVDQFIGKLLDIGADRGVIYSFSSFTSSAVMRCERAMNPNVIAIAVETPGIVEHMQGVPGYPADLAVQEVAPQWIEEMDKDAFLRFLESGEWSNWWS